MLANNEIGTIQPLAEIGRLCQERGVLLHCDATQGVGKMPVNVDQLHVDLMSFTAHKIYGPKGVGTLYVRRENPQARIEPQIHGGGHEFGLRSGTLNVPGIVGLARALEICLDEMPGEKIRLVKLRNQLYNGLTSNLSGLTLNGPSLFIDNLRLPGNLNFSFANIDGATLLLNMKEIALSSNSACASGKTEPSHVLLALGIDELSAWSSVRFGLGRFNSVEDIDYTIARITEVANRLRKMITML